MWTISQATVGSFIAILILTLIDRALLLGKAETVMMTASFGAQAVLLFAAPLAPLAQPYNCFVGNIISAFIGVSIFKMSDQLEVESHDYFLPLSLSLSLSIAAMVATKSIHPPAGATTLLAVFGGKRITDLGYLYILFPALLGSMLHVLMAFLMNNMSNDINRKYPLYWIPFDTSPLTDFFQ